MLGNSFHIGGNVILIFIILCFVVGLRSKAMLYTHPSLESVFDLKILISIFQRLWQLSLIR
jgi:hypothetical protein